MTVFVNAIMYYKVKDCVSAVANVDDYGGSARLLAATTLRNILGTKTLGDILSDRESIAREMQLVLDEGTEPWGVQVEGGKEAGDEGKKRQNRHSEGITCHEDREGFPGGGADEEHLKLFCSFL